jgi:hypothetical protein
MLPETNIVLVKELSKYEKLREERAKIILSKEAVVTKIKESVHRPITDRNRKLSSGMERREMGLQLPRLRQKRHPAALQTRPGVETPLVGVGYNGHHRRTRARNSPGDVFSGLGRTTTRHKARKSSCSTCSSHSLSPSLTNRSNKWVGQGSS